MLAPLAASAPLTLQQDSEQVRPGCCRDGRLTLHHHNVLQPLCNVFRAESIRGKHMVMQAVIAGPCAC
jgi:hypothetical protein